MTWIVVVSVAVAGCLTYRRVTDRGRHSFSLAFVVLVALASGWFVWREWKLESELTTAVRALTGDDSIDVECQGFFREFRLDNNLGEVAFDGQGGLSTTAELRGSVCSELRDWLGSNKSAPSRSQIIAVHVLAHEAVHASGVADEARTECLAMQRDEVLAGLLGASPDQAHDLAERYWREIFPRMPSSYRGVECREDGELDATPGDDRWPGGLEVASP